jgi:hypothetical protein
MAKEVKEEKQQQPPQFYRQGDLLLRRIDSLPQGLTELSTSILAQGEATGHHHRLTSQAARVFRDDANQQKYLLAEEPTQLEHEEHKPITIEKGLYVLIQEREFDPFPEVIRRVVD